MNTLSFLLSDKAAGQRMSGRKPAFVVHVETEWRHVCC